MTNSYYRVNTKHQQLSRQYYTECQQGEG